ncbi:unnamed protein product [Protopolystoma xenopodis]|uniref:G-protein coupled receptors family 1 profile domain-containing protein n=1 Tax=Protopolystoma xenopodis TaxID=117903 RepID=A0A448XC80_9PLAT|nr:unnamed protein product [Protopolystoma xenopodis]
MLHGRHREKVDVMPKVGGSTINEKVACKNRPQIKSALRFTTSLLSELHGEKARLATASPFNKAQPCDTCHENSDTNGSAVTSLGTGATERASPRHRAIEGPDEGDFITSAAVTTTAKDIFSSQVGAPFVGSQLRADAKLEKKRKLRARVTKQVIVVTSLYGFCWLPTQFINAWFNIDRHGFPMNHAMKQAKFISQTLSFAASCINPIVYSLMSSSFRMAMAHQFHGLIRRDAGLRNGVETTLVLGDFSVHR